MPSNHTLLSILKTKTEIKPHEPIWKIGSSLNIVRQRLHCRGAPFDFAHLIIKCLFIHQVMSFILAGLCFHLCGGSPLLSSIFRPEWISFLCLFCSFWHPTKLIASEGIGVEGLVLFWQFFQERPSISWWIVLETDLSLLNSWLAAKSRCYKGIESFRGTL